MARTIDETPGKGPSDFARCGSSVQRLRRFGFFFPTVCRVRARSICPATPAFEHNARDTAECEREYVRVYAVLCTPNCMRVYSLLITIQIACTHTHTICIILVHRAIGVYPVGRDKTIAAKAFQYEYYNITRASGYKKTPWWSRWNMMFKPIAREQLD